MSSVITPDGLRRALSRFQPDAVETIDQNGATPRKLHVPTTGQRWGAVVSQLQLPCTVVGIRDGEVRHWRVASTGRGRGAPRGRSAAAMPPAVIYVNPPREDDDDDGDDLPTPGEVLMDAVADGIRAGLPTVMRVLAERMDPADVAALMRDMAAARND